MAGEWLKFEKATPDKPEVFAIAARLDMDPDAVVGKLIRVWSWFDTHTTDGNGAGVTRPLLDRIAGVMGFVAGMESVGWLVATAEGVSLPNFDRHTGETSKGRALGAKRASEHRAKSNGASVTQHVTTALPREEKRREEKKEQKTAPCGVLFPGVDSQVAADFTAMRKSMRAAITPTAVAGLTREGVKAGLTLQDVMALCCERGWRGFKAEWLENDGKTSNGPKASLGNPWDGAL